MSGREDQGLKHGGMDLVLGSSSSELNSLICKQFRAIEETMLMEEATAQYQMKIMPRSYRLPQGIEANKLQQ